MKTQRKRKIFYVDGLQEINIVKMSILPKVSHRFNAIAIKIPRIFFTKIKILKMHENTKDSKQPKKSWEKNQSHQNPDFKLHYKTIIIISKTMVLGKKKKPDTQIDETKFKAQK